MYYQTGFDEPPKVSAFSTHAGSQPDVCVQPAPPPPYRGFGLQRRGRRRLLLFRFRFRRPVVVFIWGRFLEDERRHLREKLRRAERRRLWDGVGAWGKRGGRGGLEQRDGLLGCRGAQVGGLKTKTSKKALFTFFF